MSKIDIKKNQDFYKKKGTSGNIQPVNNVEDFKQVELNKNEQLLKIQ